MRSLICGSWTYKINVQQPYKYRHNLICIYIYIYTYIHIYLVRERESKIVLEDPSEGTTGGGRGKENVRE
jgi:hypothetical protein